MSAVMKTNADAARAAWGDDIPNWVLVLAEQCDASSQKAAAERIGYSPAVVNTVLKHTYKGDLTAVEQAVRGALLDATVLCPVAGELPAHVCLDYQRQPFRSTNAQRVKLYRACRSGCPNKRG
jgi:hypothetical protein